MALKRGLGKGLDSLIPTNVMMESEVKHATVSTASSPEEEKDGTLMVKLSKVEPNREQPRKNFDEDSLQELAESLKQFGMLQPILVQNRGDYYEIIAGERRWRAAKIAGLKEVPIAVQNVFFIRFSLPVSGSAPRLSPSHAGLPLNTHNILLLRCADPDCNADSTDPAYVSGRYPRHERAGGSAGGTSADPDLCDGI